MRRIGHVTAAVCIGALAFGGCGDDKKSDSKSSGAKTEKTPEEVIAPDAKVASGLGDLVKVADGIAAKTDSAASKQASKGLEPVWMKVEGTVKKKEPGSYATIEEDLSLLETGDSAKTKTGAAEMKKTVTAYLAKHPG